MKHGFLNTHYHLNNSPCSGLELILQLQWNWIRCDRPEYLCRRFSRMGKEFCRHTDLKKFNQLTGEFYSKVITKVEENCVKIRPACRKKIFRSTKSRCPQSPVRFGKIRHFSLWSAVTFTLFLRFGSFWLPSVPKTKSIRRWSTISSNQEAIAAIEG